MRAKEINEILATKVMGWNEGEDMNRLGAWMNEDLFVIMMADWEPATNTRQAIEALNEYCDSEGGDFQLHRDGSRFYCAILHGGRPLCHAYGDTFSEAISKCLVRAVRE